MAHKHFTKVGAKLFLFTCKLSQESKISSDYQNNIVVPSASSDIILDCQIKIHVGWVA